MPTYDGSGFDAEALFKRSYEDYEREWAQMTPAEREEHHQRVREGFAIVLALASAFGAYE